MKILNLTDIETSEIKYEVFKFPDGQQQVKILGTKKYHTSDNGHGTKFIGIFLNIGNIVTIKSRLNNFKDLELIVCATKSLRELGVKEIHLYTPYFLGSRSDRKFEEGSNNYLKDVICPIINSLNFESVTVLDPHSDVLEACLNNFKKESNLELVKFTFENLDWNYRLGTKTPYDKLLIQNTIDNCILVSPDAGASKKIFKIAEQIGYTGDIITCSKSRDENGKLTKCVVPLEHKHLRKDYIIIDDICDGGATFINIAKELKITMQNDPHAGKIYLIVTHGIFSKGFKELNKYFDGIYCTNSYRDVADDEYGEKTNVKQLNVFYIWITN